MRTCSFYWFIVYIKPCPRMWLQQNVFQAKYQQLLAVGKPKKVAIIACIRKLVITLNSMVRDGVYCDPIMN
jgi:hypothetical protein